MSEMHVVSIRATFAPASLGAPLSSAGPCVAVSLCPLRLERMAPTCRHGPISCCRRRGATGHLGSLSAAADPRHDFMRANEVAPNSWRARFNRTPGIQQN